MKTLRLGSRKYRWLLPGESAHEQFLDRQSARSFLEQLSSGGKGLDAVRDLLLQAGETRPSEDTAEHELLERAAELLVSHRLRVVRLATHAPAVARPPQEPAPTPPEEEDPPATVEETEESVQLVTVEPTADAKWYVNLNADATKKYGREVEIKATVSPTKSGVTVNFELEPDAGNTDETKLSADQKASLSATSATTDGSGVAKVTLTLSSCGLDKFRVVGSLDGVKKQSGWLSVWRLLYYQQTRMDASYSFPFDKVTGEYADHGIELISSGAVVDGAHKDNLETAQLEAYAQTYHKKRQEPFEAHILLIDRQCDSKTEPVAQTQNVVSDVYPFADDVWPFADWLVKAEWKKSSEATWDNTGIAVTKSADDEITVDLSSIGVDPTAESVEISVTVKLLKGSYTGDATYKPHMFIATGVPRSDASKSKTVNHEVGHGVGMVPTSDHDLQYANANGGMGSHCRKGATPDEKSLAQGGTFAGTYSGGTCVMYHASSEHYGFCDTCALHVKKGKMAETDMKGRGWG